jgi:pimeloyl-ACP methyl ester carboxylesterase
LLIHGLGDEADTWRYLIPALSAHRRVIALDLPGFGRSDKPRRAYTVAFFQDTILNLLDTLTIPRAVLIGHSLGALIAHTLALRCPERVERLILIGGSPLSSAQKVSLATLLFLIPTVGEWQYNRLRADPDAAYRSLAPYYSSLAALPEAEQSFLRQRVNERVWSDGQRDAFLSTLRNLARWLPGQQGGLPARLALLTTPTLAIWGERDSLQPVENGHALVKMQPTARLVVVPGAGHNVQQEQPDAVLDAINGELNQ